MSSSARASDLGERRGLLDEAAQHAGAALGRLGEQHPPAVVEVGQRFAVELGVLELEGGLERTLQGSAQGHRDLVRGGVGQPQHEHVAAVFDVRGDLLLVLDVLGAVEGVGVHGGVGCLLVRQPRTFAQVQPVAAVVGFLRRRRPTLAMRMVGGVAVGELEHRLAVEARAWASMRAGAVAAVGEPEGHLELVAALAALLLVAADAFAAPGEHGLQAQQPVLGDAELLAAVLAGVGADLDRVVVAAAFAALGGLGDGAGAGGVAGVAGQLDADDLVAGAFVVDQGARGRTR